MAGKEAPFRRSAVSVLRLCLVSCLVQTCCCEKVLLLLSDDALANSHSELVSVLSSGGMQVETRRLTDSTLQLQHWSTWLYDGVVVLSKGSSDLGGALDSSWLVDFVDDGGSLFVATDEKPSASIREIAAQFGADFVQQGAAVVDHVSHDAKLGPSSLLTEVMYPSAVMNGTPGLPVLYKGGALTTSADSTLAIRALMPSPTAAVTSGDPRLDISGFDVSLAVGMQSRTNARFCVVASLDVLSDQSFGARVTHAATSKSSETGNRAFGQSLLRWTMGLQGVLKHQNVHHHRTGEHLAPMHSTYTVNDNITMEVQVLERWGSDWVPHVSDSLVAQYTMLDPYVRQPMQHKGGGNYELTFRAPDVYGVFKYVVDYNRPGYSFLQFEELMPLRPLRHDQYPRFILQAYPYYAALLSISIGFFATIAATMYTKS